MPLIQWIQQNLSLNDQTIVDDGNALALAAGLPLVLQTTNPPTDAWVDYQDDRDLNARGYNEAPEDVKMIDSKARYNLKAYYYGNSKGYPRRVQGHRYGSTGRDFTLSGAPLAFTNFRSGTHVMANRNVTPADVAKFSVGSWSVSFWIKAKNMPSDQPLPNAAIDQRNVFDMRGWAAMSDTTTPPRAAAISVLHRINTTPGSAATFPIRSFQVTWNEVISGVSFGRSASFQLPIAPIGQWFHVAITKQVIASNNIPVKIYGNGLLAQTVTVTTGNGNLNTFPVSKGQITLGGGIARNALFSTTKEILTSSHQMVDDLKLFDRVLTAAEVYAIATDTSFTAPPRAEFTEIAPTGLSLTAGAPTVTGGMTPAQRTAFLRIL